MGTTKLESDNLEHEFLDYSSPVVTLYILLLIFCSVGLQRRLNMNVLPIVATAGMIFVSTPVAVKSGETQKTCRQEAIRHCVKRLMSAGGGASEGINQRREAEQFCSERPPRC